jgi:hypothetical protein
MAAVWRSRNDSGRTSALRRRPIKEIHGEPEKILLSNVPYVRKRDSGRISQWPSLAQRFFSDGCRATFKDRHRRKVRHGRQRRQATREMQVAEDGLSTLSLKDGSGKDRVELRVAAAGSAGLGFFDQNGHELAVFGEGADGRSGLRIFGRQGKQVAALGSLPTGESSLTLYDANTGRARVGLGSRRQGRARTRIARPERRGSGRTESPVRRHTRTRVTRRKRQNHRRLAWDPNQRRM